jgi:hypothetical protein
MRKALNISLKEGNNSTFLVVNGIADKHGWAIKSARGLLHAEIRDERPWTEITAFRVGDLAQHFATVSASYEAGWEGWDKVEVGLWSVRGRQKRQISFSLHPNYECWAKPYSIAEYAEAFENSVKTLALSGVAYYEQDILISNGFGIRCSVTNRNPVLSDELGRCAEVLKRICEKAEEMLSTTARRNAVTSFFSFPPEVKTACEQYLLYFVQFLGDLGIQAEAGRLRDPSRGRNQRRCSEGPLQRYPR